MSSINVSHVNVQGFLNNYNSIEVFARVENVDILCISEHWMTGNDFTHIHFGDYKIVSIFARQHHIHGGALILAKDIAVISEISAISRLSMECHVEICAINIKIGNRKISVITIYRPPTGNMQEFIDCLTQALETASKRSDFIILCGDFNIDSQQSNINTKLLFDVINTYQMNDNQIGPTRIFTYANGHISSSSIDYMVTNLSTDIYNCTLIQPNIADHLAYILKFKITDTENEIKHDIPISMKRHINSNNIAEFKTRLNATDWTPLFNLNVNEGWDYFCKSIAWCFDVSCPKKLVRHKQKSKTWITEEIIQEGQTMKDLFWLVSGMQEIEHEIRNTYNSRMKEYKRNLNQAKVNHYSNKICNANNKTKETWNIINKELGRKSSSQKSITLLHGSEEVKESIEISELFAQHFSNAAEMATLNHFGENLSLPCSIGQNVDIAYPFESYPITETEVLRTLNIMKNKNSAGIDELSIPVLKKIIDVIVKPLIFLMNQSLIQGCFPPIFKQALVIPLHKKGSENDIDNYRQISLLCSLSKLYEKVIGGRITEHLELNSLLCDSQYGFRQKRSVETASYHLVNYIYQQIDSNNYVISLFFDLSKAFDTVCSEFLITKLENCGFPKNVINWLDSYLSNRTMAIKYNTTLSKFHSVKLGVPQGSVLGPLLFLIFVNDLPSHITGGNITMFADDTAITVAGRGPEILIKKIDLVIEEFSAWCQRNRLILNKSKSVSVKFYLRRCISDEICELEDIPTAVTTKYLGTHLDSYLSWDMHIDSVCAKLNKAYYAIKLMKNCLDKPGLIKVYFAMVYSHISLNIMVWGCAKDFSRVFVAQKRIIRLMFNMGYLESCKPVFLSETLLTAPSIYILKCVMFARSHLNLYQTSSSLHNHNTRHGNLLRIPSHRTSHFKKSPLYNAIVLYNKLPQTFKQNLSDKVFRVKIKSLLLEKCYYSHQEYLHDNLA